MLTFLQICQNTPPWVFGLFLLLLAIGLRARKTRTVHPSVLLIMPILFTIFSLKWVIPFFTIDATRIWIFLLCALMGCAIGYTETNKNPVQFNPVKHKITVPGNHSILWLIFINFFARFYQEYNLLVQPTRLMNPLLILITLGIAGFTLGFVIGKMISYVKQYLD